MDRLGVGSKQAELAGANFGRSVGNRGGRLGLILAREEMGQGKTKKEGWRRDRLAGREGGCELQHERDKTSGFDSPRGRGGG